MDYLNDCVYAMIDDPVLQETIANTVSGLVISVVGGRIFYGKWRVAFYATAFFTFLSFIRVGTIRLYFEGLL